MSSITVSSASSSTIGSSGTCRFNISSKCSRHLSFVAESSFKRLPCLSFTVLIAFLLSLLRVFVISYKFFHSPISRSFRCFCCQIFSPPPLVPSHTLLYFLFHSFIVVFEILLNSISLGLFNNILRLSPLFYQFP